jgi:hypothetical protein
MWVPIVTLVVLAIFCSAGLYTLVFGILVGTALTAIGGGLAGYGKRRKEILAY